MVAVTFASETKKSEDRIPIPTAVWSYGCADLLRLFTFPRRCKGRVKPQDIDRIDAANERQRDQRDRSDWRDRRDDRDTCAGATRQTYTGATWLRR